MRVAAKRRVNGRGKVVPESDAELGAGFDEAEEDVQPGDGSKSAGWANIRRVTLPIVNRRGGTTWQCDRMAQQEMFSPLSARMSPRLTRSHHGGR